MKWDAKLVEELLKRIDHRLALSYDANAKDLLLQALAKYNSGEFTAHTQGAKKLVSTLYQSPVLKNIVVDSNANNKADPEGKRLGF